jgi:DNA-binding NtrC family response regulator
MTGTGSSPTPWPGNIREPQNVIERSCIPARGPVVKISESLSVADGRYASGASSEVPTLQHAEREAIGCSNSYRT